MLSRPGQSAVIPLSLPNSAPLWEDWCHSSEQAGFGGGEAVPTWRHRKERPGVSRAQAAGWAPPGRAWTAPGDRMCLLVAARAPALRIAGLLPRRPQGLHE